MLLFQQFVDDGLGCASYLVGDDEAGVAVVVDPAFGIEQYLDAAARQASGSSASSRPTRTPTTSPGTAGFALEHGVPVADPRLAEAEFPHEPLADGDSAQVGATDIRVLHTPGHRPEHCTFVVDERIALTGDSMFVGDAARPDLAVDAREGAEDLFHSLARLAELPDESRCTPATLRARSAAAT